MSDICRCNSCAEGILELLENFLSSQTVSFIKCNKKDLYKILTEGIEMYMDKHLEVDERECYE